MKASNVSTAGVNLRIAMAIVASLTYLASPRNELLEEGGICFHFGRSEVSGKNVEEARDRHHKESHDQKDKAVGNDGNFAMAEPSLQWEGIKVWNPTAVDVRPGWTWQT